MEKTALGLIAALGAAAVATSASANVAPATAEKILQPASVAELLEPVANPLETLRALESGRQLEAVEDGQVQVAETVVVRRTYHTYRAPSRVVVIRRYGYHHHHHHWRRYHHHHHGY